MIRIRSAWTIAGLLALALAMTVAGGQAALAQSKGEVRKRSDAKNRALTSADKQGGEPEAELARLKDDFAQLRAKQLETAKLIQASEAQLSAIEQRRGELEAQEGIVRGSLDKERGSLSGLLAAMQRMGRNPPPVMITRREDALAMVRSAKLIAASAPHMAAKANALADKLADLARVLTSLRGEEDKLRAETKLHAEAQKRLVALAELRKQTIEDRESERARRAAAETTKLARKPDAELPQVLPQLDKAIAENTQLGEYEKQLAAGAGTASPTGGGPAEVQPRPVATTDIKPAAKPAVVAAAPTAPAKPMLKPSIIIAPGERMAMASPGRIQPSIPFADAKGKLPMPAQGRRVVSFGEKTQRGPGAFQGIAIETRFGAQVTSPTDGWVVYAGEFRSYGQILIINAGGGYHILLANMSQIDAAQGQFLLAGEPVGTMAPAPKGVTAGRGQQEGAPILYVEFKKDNRSIDPEPWWAPPVKRNAGLITPNVILPQFAPG